MNKRPPMRLHLVTIHASRSPQAVPMAAACLKAYLDARPANGKPVTVSCAEFICDEPLRDISSAIQADQPDIVAFSMYAWNRVACCSLAQMLRSEAPGLTIIAGGPEATADPVGVMAEAPFDFLVVGEGELTISEVLDRLDDGRPLDGVGGIARRADGEVVVVRRPPVTDLGALPSPYLSGILDGHIPDGVLWQLSRGCSFGCDFCFDGMGDRTVRRYPLERLEAELDHMVRRGVNQIFVLDSTFNQDAKRAKTLLRLIWKKAPHVHFHFEIRSELLDAEQARLFAGLACSLQIGLQTSDPKIARNVKRSLDRGDFIAKIGLLNSSGAVFGFDLIYGLPGDSLARFKEGLDFALALYPNHLDIFPLAVLPGTALAARACDLKLRHLDKPPYTIIESPTFPAADVAAARQLAAACDIFYSRGKAVAWFNGIVAALRLTPASFLESFAG
ncbi:MAG TPA: radical SAM protein, partial [Geobacteraceae bacterium]|nr:radical SAM protein [Geobacteraceae bacterium]